jgi:hypothetical protein
MKPQTWIEEDRGEIAEAITDGIIRTMTLEDMRRMVWDMLYDDLVQQHWSYLFEHAEAYAPELLEKFSENADES